jgi:hypothetical protein
VKAIVEGSYKCGVVYM